MNEPKQITLNIGTGASAVIIGLLALIALLMLSLMFPAPYNVRYAFNRIFYEPTFTCKDGIYSFAKTRQGACSGHGGVR